MKDFGQKFKLIFIPFVLITVATIAVYSALDWFFFIKTTAFNVDEEDINVIGPMLVPWIPILIWIRPRIQLLRLKKSGRRDPLMGYFMIAWAVIGFPLAVSQQYLVTATGKLTKLDHISQINDQPKTKYYTLSHYYIDKTKARIMPEFRVTDKGRSYDMYIYAPCPILDHPSDTVNALSTVKTDANQISAPFAWLAVKYEKSVSNYLSSDEKAMQYSAFRDEAMQNFTAKNLNDFVYLNRIPEIPETRDLKGYREAIIPITSTTIPPLAILSPVNEPYENRNGDKLQLTLKLFVIGSFVFLITLTFSPLRSTQDQKEND